MVYCYQPYVNTETWTRACRVRNMLTQDTLEHYLIRLTRFWSLLEPIPGA
jgi:hypothetical protein